MTGQPAGFTTSAVASTALPRGQMAQPGRTFSGMAPVTCLRLVRGGLLK